MRSAWHLEWDAALERSRIGNALELMQLWALDVQDRWALARRRLVNAPRPRR
jgi:IS5 family transposase